MSEASEPEDHSDEPWRRLNGRMLFVHPLRELIRYLPVLLIALVAGSVGGEPWWVYALSGFGIVIGILRWVTTSYRITETHVQIHRGILNRTLRSVPRDRIRSVDVDSTILHRLFRLSVVKVGTGASHGADDLEFNAMATRDVAALRTTLLQRTRLAHPDGELDEATAPADYSRWSPSWVRFAPFTLSGVGSIVVVAFFVLQIQFFDDGALTRLPWVRIELHQLSVLPRMSVVIWGAIILVVAASLVAMARYLLSYGRFTISRVDDSTLHLSHGLLRARQITIDERRLRGVLISEPLSLRATGATSARAVMTGLGRQRGGVALLSPPGPREALRISAELLGIDEPLRCELVQHGPVAYRRRYTRAGTFALVLAAIAGLLQSIGEVDASVWWAFVVIVPASLFLAWDRYRGLGHAVPSGWLVARSGSLNRRRIALRTEGIIGWTIRRSYFQRRAGLATLIATTAAGRHRYSIPDLPFVDVWPLIERLNEQASTAG